MKRLSVVRVSCAAAVLFGAISCTARPVDLLPLADEDPAGASQGGAPSLANSSGGEPGDGSSPGGQTGSGGSGSEPSTPLALLVVDENPIGSDDALETRLEERGIPVTRISELELLPEDASSFDLVIVSPSADRKDLGSTLKGVDVPVLFLEPSVASRHGLGSSAGGGTVEVEILAPQHSIASGFESPTEVCKKDGAQSGIQLIDGAQAIAASSGVSAWAPVVAYPAGLLVEARPIPNRRALVGLLKFGGCQTEASYRFFDSAVDWLLER